MKKRLLCAMLACLMILGGAARADGVEETVLAAGQIGVFTDCVVTLNEIAWYGDVQSNLLIPATGGAPTILAVRAQVMNRSMASRDLALDSAFRVRYGTAYDQAGVVAEEAFAASEGLYFVRSSSIQADPLQPVNIVAYVRLPSLLYYSAEQLEVELTVGGHPMKISLDGQAADSSAVIPAVQATALPTGGPYVVNPPDYAQSDIQPAPQTPATLKVPVSYLDADSRLLANPTYLDVPVGGMAVLTAPDLPNSAFDHYSYLKDGRWYDGAGSSVIVYSDRYGSLDKQEIRLIYRSWAPTPTPTAAPAYSAGQIVRPASWDTQFRPGISTAPNGQGDNANVYKQLKNLYDDNPNTSISWILYVSERTDGLPEFTATFDAASISAIGVRNGKATSEKEYYQYARLASLHLRFHTISGAVYNTWVYLPDEYSPDYQILPLDKTYKSIFSVELWIEGNVNQGFYLGEDDTAYIMQITDIQFYLGSPTVSTQSPSGGYSY